MAGTRECRAARARLGALLLLAAACPACGEWPAQHAAVTVWAQSPLVKVFPGSQPDESLRAEPRLEAARGEREALQYVLSPRQPLREVRLTAGPLEGPAVLSAEAVEVRWVAYVLVTTPSGPQGQVGENPDPLPEQLRGDLLPGRAQAAWVTVAVPREAPPGEYRGHLELTWKDGALSLPLLLTVWDFALPASRRLLVSADFRLRELERYGEGGPEARERYLRNMAEHGVNTTGVPRPRVRLRADGGVEVDWTALDEWAETCRRLGLVHLSLPVPWFEHDAQHRWRPEAAWTVIGPQQRPVRLPAFTGEEPDPAFAAALTDYLRQVVAHYRERGWWGPTSWAQFTDEPDLSDPYTLRRVLRMSQLLRQAVPDLPLMHTRPPTQELLDWGEVWMPGANLLEPSAPLLDEARRRGHLVGVYHNTIALIDYTPLRVRCFPWGLWTRELGLVGAWWTLTNWTKHPWLDPLVGAGRNGDGVLLYPPRDAHEQGPITSIRWETFRDGLEDWDYLELLRQRAAEIPGAAELLAEARQVMPQFPPVRGETRETYWTSAERLEDLRRRLAGALSAPGP